MVVVMAERDKEEMELDIAKMEFDFRGTSVLCRSGSPLILADLKKVYPIPGLNHMQQTAIQNFFYHCFLIHEVSWPTLYSFSQMGGYN